MTISRRALLLAAPGALACEGEFYEEEPMGLSGNTDRRSGIPPWHMWGSSTGITPANNAPNAVSATFQMATVRYKRPENWQFMLGAKVLRHTSAGTGNIFVVFDLQVGVGRSMMLINAWHTFHFTIVGNLLNPVQKWASQVQPPAVDDSFPAVVAPPCNALTAETINLVANVIYNPGFLNVDVCQLQVDAQFAPSTHVRPEWYEHQYPGGETGGA